ncbi:MAG: hypothetical protein RLZZ401_1692 [Pseudomonadota bacterium]|jgi:general secretion pathway protein J
MRSMRPSRGFTLIELMVAIGILALVAVLSWRGLDGMTRAQTQTQARADQVLATQAALGQWRADLDAVVQLPGYAPLDWDGRVLRMTRRSLTAPADGLLVVGWAQRDIDGQTQWLRWQSPALRTRGDLQTAWQRASVWARTPGDEDRQREVAISPVTEWQVFYFRGNAWSNAQSSAGTSTSASTVVGAVPVATDNALPEGVRLNLTLPPSHPLAGKLTLDWNRPTLSGGKS